MFLMRYTRTGLPKCIRYISQSSVENFQLVVIGGGSGGLAAAKEATKFGIRTALLDYVKPSPHGKMWGLGGTCVNVGCIPKKLFHHVALCKDMMTSSPSLGFLANERNQNKLDWNVLVKKINEHVMSLNWGYRRELHELGVKFINSFGTFEDPHTLACTDSKGRVRKISGDKIIIAVGSRPSVPNIEGSEHCLTSDDIFSLSHPPGKTLVVGGSYVGLECAGFLTGLGFDTTVMSRSAILREFDGEFSAQIKKFMRREGTKFLGNSTPVRIEKTKNSCLKVSWLRSKSNSTKSSDFDTVLLATGRIAATKDLHLENCGVRVAKENGKIIVDDEERTTASHIYAIGDVIQGGRELTPVAVQAGKLLSRRIFGGFSEKMDYTNVPTTVFTPLEYGSVGLTEEMARSVHGEKNIQVYHSHFQPLEDALTRKLQNKCYAKLICVKNEQERVVGLHILSPSAGEITQGFALAVKKGLLKKDLDSLVGIHPTIAEEFTTMNITKESGKTASKGGC